MANSNVQRIPRQPYESNAYGKVSNMSAAPSSGTVVPFPQDRIRNIERTTRTNTGAKDGYPTIDDQFYEKTYGQAGIQLGNRTDNKADSTTAANVQYAPPRENRGIGSMPRVRRKKKRKSAAYKAGKVAARVRVSIANGWIIGWVMFWYTFVQLPFAVMSAVGLGAAATIYSYISNLPGGRTVLELGGNVLTIGGNAAAIFSKIVEFVATHFFNLPFNPLLVFLIPFILLFALGLMQLLICWFIYSITGIKSLSGSYSSAKKATFLFAAIGTVIPFLNLFPLILIWTSVVWFKPK